MLHCPNILYFIAGHQTHADFWGCSTNQPAGSSVSKHLIRHGFPFTARLAIPALSLGNAYCYLRPLDNITGGLLSGPCNYTLSVCTTFSSNLVLDSLIAATAVKGGDHEFTAPSWIAVDNVHILHNHQRISSHSLSHIDSYCTVANVLFTSESLRNNGGEIEHLGHALEKSKTLFAFKTWAGNLHLLWFGIHNFV